MLVFTRLHGLGGPLEILQLGSAGPGGLRGAGEHVKDVIDENRFHNCLRQSEKALLVPVSTKRIAAGHERGR